MPGFGRHKDAGQRKERQFAQRRRREREQGIKKREQLGRIQRRSGTGRGVTRSWAKERRGDLNLTQLLGFFQTRLAKKKLPTNTQLKTISTEHKAAWLADAFKRSDAARFGPMAVEKIILPLAAEHPAKFASGLGKSGRWFFIGLDKKAEQFFTKLADAGKLEKFLKRLQYKDHIAYGNPYSLGRGVAKNVGVFFEIMGERGFNLFVIKLREKSKTSGFLLGLKEILGGTNPLYLQAKKKLPGKG